MKGLALVSRILVTALLVLALVGVVLLFMPKVREYQGLRRQEAQARAALMQDEEHHKNLKRQQERFQNEPAFVEVIAHDLGLAKTNEVLVKIKSETPPPEAPPARPPR